MSNHNISSPNTDNNNMNNHRGKKYNCEVIQDLLPLYQDSICSVSSRAIIEEHLMECPDCRTIANKLNSSRINQLEEHLMQEKNDVLATHFKKERKRTFTVGLCTAGILMIPVIVCLICNLAIGHGLDWFFIVLTSLLLTASITVVPLMLPEHTGLWTLGSFVASLLLLLLVICIYTRGNWFFLAAVPTIFGLSIVFAPYVIHNIPLPKPLTQCKGLLSMIWDTLWLYAVIAVCGMHSNHPDYFRIALEITSFCILLPWLLFLTIRYLRVQPLCKAGICTLITGIFTASINSVISLILRVPNHSSPRYANLFHWSDDTINANTAVIILLITIPVGIILIISGYIREHKKTA